MGYHRYRVLLLVSNIERILKHLHYQANLIPLLNSKNQIILLMISSFDSAHTTSIMSKMKADKGIKNCCPLICWFILSETPFSPLRVWR
jgi:hypothetical protein